MSVLPRYTDVETDPLLSGAKDTTNNDVKTAIILIDDSEETLRVGGDACERNEGRFGFFKRLRARCEKRRAQRRAMACTSEQCTKRRKRFCRFFMFFIGAIFIFSMAKMAYMYHTLPKRVHCEDVSATSMTLEMPLSKSILVHHSLTGGTSSIVHSTDSTLFDDENDETPSTFKVQLEFEEGGDPALVCNAKLKKGTLFGAFTKEDDGTLAKVKSTTIILPPGLDKYPVVRFGSNAERHCGENFIRRLIRRRTEIQE